MKKISISTILASLVALSSSQVFADELSEIRCVILYETLSDFRYTHRLCGKSSCNHDMLEHAINQSCGDFLTLPVKRDIQQASTNKMQSWLNEYGLQTFCKQQLIRKQEMMHEFGVCED